MKHILLSCGAYGAALDIFSHGIFMVYLKFVCRKFDVMKNTDISEAAFFWFLYLAACLGVFIEFWYMCSIRMDSAWCQESKYVT